VRLRGAGRDLPGRPAGPHNAGSPIPVAGAELTVPEVQDIFRKIRDFFAG
jgi:hypothetical protein